MRQLDDDVERRVASGAFSVADLPAPHRLAKRGWWALEYGPSSFSIATATDAMVQDRHLPTSCAGQSNARG